jgi:glycosyltransferase involved in cell wall biosynthesis
VIRLAIVVTDRKIWTGGYNYLLNLTEVVGKYLGDRVTPVLFFGDDVQEGDVVPFAGVRGAEIVRAPSLRQTRRTRTAVKALLWGVDPAVRDVFDANQIDVVVEAAQFFGWRLRQPAIAWMADFQHRRMRHLFSASAYWKRELGFQAEIVAGRSIILSSEDARNHCEQFYPSTRGRTHVLRFAVAARPRADAAEITRITAAYGLPADFYFLPNQFWRHKNHECVIRALGRLKGLGRRGIVVAASGNPLDRGDPDHWRRLERLIQDLDVTENFRLLGMIPTEHLHVLLQSCVALINPSMSEGWSTTVEEAKSAGTPMILSDLAVHREQVGESAAFFDPRNDEQLAEVFLNYVPVDSDSRAKLAAKAAISSAAAMERFARDLLRVVANTTGTELAHP